MEFRCYLEYKLIYTYCKFKDYHLGFYASGLVVARQQQNSECYTYVLGVQLPNGTSGNTLKPNRKKRNGSLPSSSSSSLHETGKGDKDVLLTPGPVLLRLIQSHATLASALPGIERKIETRGADLCRQLYRSTGFIPDDDDGLMIHNCYKSH